MPTYEYLCRKCGHTLEEFQSMSEEALKRCPKCGTDSLARIMGTGGGFILKGSGFYGTDYRKQQSGPGDSGKKEAEKQETAQQTEEKGGEKKETETKKQTGKRDTEKKEGEKRKRGKGTPGSQPPPLRGPSGPPEKND